MRDELQTVYRPSKPWVPVRVHEPRDLTGSPVTGQLAAGVDAPAPALAPDWPSAEWVAGEGNLARFLIDTGPMAPGPYSVFLRIRDNPEDLIIRAAGVLWIR